jgi:hypothetical protein
MRSLLDWLRFRPRFSKLGAVLEAVRLILWDFHPLVLPYCAQSDTLIYYGLRVTSEVYKDFLEPEFHKDLYPGDMQHLANCVGSMLGILKCIVANGSTAQTTAFHKLYTQELLSAYHIIYDIAEVIEISFRNQHRPSSAPKLESLHEHGMKTLRDIIPLGGYLYQSIYAHSPELTSQCTNKAFLQSPAFTVHHTDSPPASAWNRLLKIMIFLQDCKRCCSSRCVKTLRNDTLWKCSGCKRVQYCSRKCQKQAWVEAAHPHRTICHALSIICQRLSIPGEGITVERHPQPSAVKVVQNTKEMNLLADHFDNLFASQYQKLGTLMESSMILCFC